MNDVPSTTMLMAVSAIIACIVMAVFLRAYNGNHIVSEIGEKQQQEMQIGNTTDDYMQYADSVIDGYKLRAFLKTCTDGDITVYVRNGAYQNAEAMYDFRTNSFSVNAPGTQYEADIDKTRSDFYGLSDAERNLGGKKSVSEMISDHTHAAWYIAPFDNYKCTAFIEHGDLRWLSFARQ